MKFFFENECQSTDALITSIQYNDFLERFEIALLGTADNQMGFTVSGKMMMQDQELKALIANEEFCEKYNFEDLTDDDFCAFSDEEKLQIAQNIIGRKVRITAKPKQDVKIQKGGMSHD